MAETMKATIVHQYNKPLRIEQVAIPELGQGEILVSVKASSLCHTDLHAASVDWPAKPNLPFIPGHQAIGAGLKEGDAVGVPWLHDACGYSEYCTTGSETLCESQHNTGYSVNGVHPEYVIAAAPYVGHLPARLDFVAMAPIRCAGVTTYKGIKETEAKPGQWIAISGIGGLGHVAVQYAVPHIDFRVAPKRITVRGSIVGRRRDLSEAIAFAADGKVKTTVFERRLDDINGIFAQMKEGQIEGRIVLPQL